MITRCSAKRQRDRAAGCVSFGQKWKTGGFRVIAAYCSNFRHVFEPPFGGLGTMYVNLGLIGKCLVDFLLVLNELFR